MAGSASSRLSPSAAHSVDGLTGLVVGNRRTRPLSADQLDAVAFIATAPVHCSRHRRHPVTFSRVAIA